jgi:DNA-binding SARP family transcriptional activator/tetratricopeptide (TPR) repeat protein
MPCAAALAAPCRTSVPVQQAAIEQAADCRLVVFSGPPGYLQTERLAATLEERGRRTLWLRLEPEDHDPATFLIKLISAVQLHCSALGRSTIEQMRQRPGPLLGWSPHFAHLGQELAAGLPAATTLVLERSHYLGGPHPTLRLFNAHLLPVLPFSMACILIAHQPLSPADLPVSAKEFSTDNLRFDERQGYELAEYYGASLATSTMRRLMALTDGCAVILDGLLGISPSCGAASLDRAVARATSAEDLLAQVARYWLATAAPDDLRALALAVHLEYSHPELRQAVLGQGIIPAGPWIQTLADNWQRVRFVWHRALMKALCCGPLEREPLRRAAEYLASQGALERAVALYLAIGETATAGRAISASLDRMMDRGQWELLASWLSQIPGRELRAWPWLVYTQGEIALTKGDRGVAHNAFALARSLFTKKNDIEGSCLSMLAQSTLSMNANDDAQAQEYARSALEVAVSAGVARYESWATWHLGQLMSDADDAEAALTFYKRAAVVATAAGDTIEAELLHPTMQYALKWRNLRRQREFYRQAYLTVERAEHEAGVALHQHRSVPADHVGHLLGTHGWLHVPLALKIPTRLPLVRAGHEVFASSEPCVATTSNGTASARALGQGAVGLDTPSPSISLTTAHEAAGGTTVERAWLPTLTVYMLGQFRVILNDQSIEEWPGSRGRSLFSYLLTHRERPIPRDMLMDVFWPDASPATARNNLNVTIHRLRQTLRAAGDVSIVIFENSAYRLNPQLHLWLDVDEFERHAQAGRRHEAADRLAAAATEYERAIGHYQGEFLEDTPYEDWSVLTREQLRVVYLDTLDHLSQMYFDQRQYTTCILVCRLILARDSCREDVHSRLMRCYSRQDQRYLALRQFHVCVAALRNELDVEPESATKQLYERIRRREPV